MLAGLLVTTLEDVLDPHDGVLSLREAILQANSDSAVSEISFDGDLSGTLSLELGELLITDSLTLVGPGQDELTIDANRLSRIFNIAGNAIDVTLEGLTMTGGRTTQDNIQINPHLNGPFETTHSGGGIRFVSQGTLALVESTLAHSSTAGNHASGGGIFTSAGEVILIGSTLSGNQTNGLDASGGGIFNFAGPVNLSDSEMLDNRTTGGFGRGGAIYTQRGSVSLTDSVVSSNRTAGDSASGGGIYTQSGAVTLTDSRLSNNQTSGQMADGGGVATFSGTLTLISSLVLGNQTSGVQATGGGIFSSSGDLVVTQSTISANSTSGEAAGGGGFFGQSGEVTIVASSLTNNRTSGHSASGGGLFSGSGDVSIQRSTVAGNRTAGDAADGGGIYANNGLISLSHSTVSGNEVSGANSRGGGLWLPITEVVISSSTITANVASGRGGGLAVNPAFFSETLTIDHSIIAGNFDQGFAPDFLAPALPENRLEVRFSLIGNNLGTSLAPAADADANGNLVGTDEAVLDPRLGPLAMQGGPTMTHALLTESPAIDAGDSELELLTSDFDQRGAPFARAFDGSGSGVARIDIGAYERQTLAASFFEVTTLDDELNHDENSRSLREAIDAANGSVGQHTITFADGLHGTIVLLLGELLITDSLSIIGPGKEQLVIDADGQSRVMNVEADRADLTLSGVTLTGGRTSGNNIVASGPTPTTYSGGGIRFSSLGALTLIDSAVVGNRTTGSRAQGGGIFTYRGRITLIGSTVSDNHTEGQVSDGGGMYSYSGHMSLTNSTVSGNSTATHFSFGGGISCEIGGVTLVNSTLSDNRTAGQYANGAALRALGEVTIIASTISGNLTTGNDANGGGIAIGAGHLTLINSTISNNEAIGDRSIGGGVWFENTALTISSSTITQNVSAASGGGIATRAVAAPRMLNIYNSIVADNHDDGSGPDLSIAQMPSANRKIRFSLIGDNTGAGLAASDTADEDGNLVGSSEARLDPGLGPLDFYGGNTQLHPLLETSPAIDAGDPDSVADVADVPLGDQRGASRIANQRIDMGAYESGALAFDVILLSPLIAGEASETVTSLVVNAAGAGKLDGWIDFGRDGIWNDPGNRIFAGIEIVAGTNVLSFTIPAGIDSGEVTSRFRLSTGGNLPPDGTAMDGQMKDLSLSVESSADVTINVAPLPPGTLTVDVESDELVVYRSDQILLRTGADSLDAVQLVGTDGDDVLELAFLPDNFGGIVSFVGGGGQDTVRLSSSGQALDMAAMPPGTFNGVETIDITGTGPNVLRLSKEQIRSLPDAASNLQLRLNTDDTLQIIEGSFRIHAARAEAGQLVVVARSEQPALESPVEIEIVGMNWTNPLQRMDVDNTGQVEPLDALMILLQLSRKEFLLDGSSELVDPAGLGDEFPLQFFDTSGDGQLTPLDALLVLNHLAGRSSAAGESLSNDSTRIAEADVASKPVPAQPIEFRQSIAAEAEKRVAAIDEIFGASLW